MTPSVGRIVHFVSSPDYKHLPMLIVIVHSDEAIGGWVLGENTMHYVAYTLHNDLGVGGTWHWPERHDQA